MPLSPPAARKHLHTRAITLSGHAREDGLYDVDAELIDRKTYPFSTGDRQIPEGIPLHHMRARLTFTDELVITAAEAVTEAGPFIPCGDGATSFTRLVGLTIKPGFLKAANQRLAGTIGCTHLRELLQQMATVALQTLYPVRARRAAEAQTQSRTKSPPRLLNTCYAYDSAGSLVQRRWPEFYTGQADLTEA